MTNALCCAVITASDASDGAGCWVLGAGCWMLGAGPAEPDWTGMWPDSDGWAATLRLMGRED